MIFSASLVTIALENWKSTDIVRVLLNASTDFGAITATGWMIFGDGTSNTVFGVGFAHSAASQKRQSARSQFSANGTEDS
jgi:hypothetical protein